ncbi:MAG: DUF2530 domain-containing protein [Rhodoglobus sp.]
MRLWLKDSERRPDPPAVKTDDRKPMLIGILIWLVALAVMLLLITPLTKLGEAWWLWTCIAGIGLGLVGILYTNWRHK